MGGAYLVAAGLDAPGLFRQDAPVELVHYLAGAFEESAHPLVTAAVLALTSSEPHCHRCQPVLPMPCCRARVDLWERQLVPGVP